MYKPVWDKTFGPCCCHYCYTFTTDHTLAGWVSPVWGKCPHRLKRATLLHNKRAVAILNYSSNVTMVLQCLQSRAGPSIASLTLLRFASPYPYVVVSPLQHREKGGLEARPTLCPSSSWQGAGAEWGCWARGAEGNADGFCWGAEGLSDMKE